MGVRLNKMISEEDSMGLNEVISATLNSALTLKQNMMLMSTYTYRNNTFCSLSKSEHFF